MGLDMWLLANKEFVNYVSEHRKSDSSVLRAEDSVLCYWRKVNSVHNWFVENVQFGEDDQDEYEVFIDDLESLKDDIKEVLDDYGKAKTIMPTQGGFFFGSTEYDDEYFDDLSETYSALEDIINCLREYKGYTQISYTCWW